jgi:hypothetical protein
MPASLAAIIGGIIWFIILHSVVRAAIISGIAAADRRRQDEATQYKARKEQAERERQQRRTERTRASQ